MSCVRLNAGRLRMRCSDGLYIIAYLLCMTDAILISYTTLNGVGAARFASVCLRAASLLVMAGKLLWDGKQRLSSILFTGAVFLLASAAMLRSGYNHLFYLAVAFLGIWNVDGRKALWADLTARLALTMVIVSCSLLGAVENYVTYRMGSTALRYSLGFNHPNTLASLAMSLTLEEAWLTRRRPGPGYALLIAATAAILYAVTLNRTAIGLMAAFPLLLPFAFRRRPVGRAERLFWELFPLLIIGFSVAAMFLCQWSPVFREFDLLMSNRFLNALKVYRQYGVSLLGQRVSLRSVRVARELHESPILLDVAYLRTLIQAGPVALLLQAALYTAAFRRACLDHDRYTVLVYALFLLYGMFESGFNNVFMNFTLLLAMRSVFRQKWLRTPGYP